MNLGGKKQNSRNKGSVTISRIHVDFLCIKKVNILETINLKSFAIYCYSLEEVLLLLGIFCEFKLSNMGKYVRLTL